MNLNLLKNNINRHIELFEKLREDKQLLKIFLDVVDITIETIEKNGKIFFAGNGGSASDAQHAAAELVVRFYKNRPPISAIALGTNTSISTAISNDFGYEFIFSRQLESLAKANDLVIGISTSGNSPSIVNLMSKAKELGCKTVGLTGKKGGKILELCDYLINCPSDEVPRIQEMHGFLLHIFCQIIEETLFKNY